MKNRLRRVETLEEPSLNLTPLIDVVFVILIMFIIIAPLLESDRIDLASAPSLEAATLNKSPITIQVDATDHIFLNAQLMNLSDLSGALQVAKQRHPDAHPQIFHDKKATFGTYQSIKNLIEHAGFSEMEVILKPE